MAPFSFSSIIFPGSILFRPSKIQYGWGTELNFKNKGITALLIFGLNPEIFSSAFNSDENKNFHYNAHNIEVSPNLSMAG